MAALRVTETSGMCTLKQSCAVLLAVAAACGGPGGEGGDDPQGGGPATPAAGSCTGPVPPDSTFCPGAGTGLPRDTPRVVSAWCSQPPTPCSHVCNAGFVVEGGACVTAPAHPPAQFSDNGDGTITVAGATGRLTWLRDAGCVEEVGVGGRAVAGGMGTWTDATSWAAGLAAGTCGLSDGSVEGDWRLPTHVELSRMALDLAAGGPFLTPQPGVYWSSWTYWPDMAGGVDIASGASFDYPRVTRLLFWPVR